MNTKENIFIKYAYKYQRNDYADYLTLLWI